MKFVVETVVRPIHCRGGESVPAAHGLEADGKLSPQTMAAIE